MTSYADIIGKRERLIRVWTGSKMIYLESLEVENENKGMIFYGEVDRCVATMDYAGRKDKNGVEIFEADIFGSFGNDKERPNEYEFHGIVIFNTDLAAFIVEKHNGGWEYLDDFLHTYSRSDLIGNIFEHSHLLTNTSSDVSTPSTND